MTDSKPRNFLIILPRQLGDILLGSSVAFALREKFPEAVITWVSHPMGKQLLNNHPALSHVLYHPSIKIDPLSSILRSPIAYLKKRMKHLKDEISFLRQLKTMNCDTAIDVICTPRTALMTYVTAAQNRIGIRTRWNRNWAYNLLIDTREWGSQYAATARLNLISSIIDPQLCLQPPERWLKSWIPNDSKISSRVEGWMNEAELKQGHFTLLSPTHRRALRRWPIERYAKLASLIYRHCNDKIVWLWGPGERELAESAHSALIEIDPDAASQSIIPPLLSLPEVAHLAGQCSIWIGNSNGLSHVAMAGGARTIQIHGPTHSAPWTHPNNLNHTSIQRSAGCTRCESNVCKQKTHECMNELSVDEVFERYKHFRMA
jgi:ADP-heptose:LPS heptosyltransferase